MTHLAKARRPLQAVVMAVSVVCACMAQPKTPAAASTTPDNNKAGAYYNFAMGRLYAELGETEGSKEDITRAIQFYQDALKLDPSAGIIFDELTDLYIQSNQLQEAVSQAEDMLKRNPDNLDARRMLGRVYTRLIGASSQDGKLDESSLRKAIEQYKIITEKDPKDAESWVVLGRLDRVAHDSPGAEKAFNSALEVEPDNEDALTGLATVYTDLGDTKGAMEKLKAASAKNPNWHTLAALAQSYEGLKDYKSAADALKRAIELAPDEEQLEPELADDLLSSNQLDEALAVFQELAAANPRDASLQLRISQIYGAKNDLAHSRAALDKAKAADPKNIAVRYQDVGLLESEGKTEDAIAVLKSIIDDTKRPHYSAAETSNREMFQEKLGLLYGNAGQYQNAVDTFRGLLNGEHDLAVHLELAQTYEKAKQYDQMAKSLDDAENLAKTDQDKQNVFFMRGEMFERQKKYDEAEAEFRKVLRINPDNASTLNYLGYMLADRAVRLDDAYQMIKKALDLDPENGAYMDSLGWVYYRQGKLTEAEDLLIKALDKMKDPTVHDHLGDVYLKLGKTKEAIAQWQASLKEAQTAPQGETDADELAKVNKKLETAQAQLARESHNK